MFASCPLGCTGDPIPLSVTSGGNVSFNATVIYTPGGNCGFKQEVSRIRLRKLQFGIVSNAELLLSCATSQTTGCSRGRVILNRDSDSSSSELNFNFILSNAHPESDSGLYEVIVEGTHPATGSFTTITKKFQLEGTILCYLLPSSVLFNNVDHTTVSSVDCGAPVPPQHGHLGPYSSTLEGSLVTFWCESGRFPIGKYTAICTNGGKWSPDPAQFVCSGELMYE